MTEKPKGCPSFWRITRNCWGKTSTCTCKTCVSCFHSQIIYDLLQMCHHNTFYCIVPAFCSHRALSRTDPVMLLGPILEKISGSVLECVCIHTEGTLTIFSAVFWDQQSVWKEFMRSAQQSRDFCNIVRPLHMFVLLSISVLGMLSCPFIFNSLWGHGSGWAFLHVAGKQSKF